MLVATRDHLPHPGAPDASHAAHPGHADHAAHGPGFHRFMTFLQVAGSMLAIPLGLASGYSIYHANFSPEARCQSLRASIISMLDKSADASTLRMLVRRDVAAFEGACGAVDPDAVAAFKTLLASNRRAPAAAPMPAAQRAARLPAPAPIQAAKPVALPKPAEARAGIKTIQRDAAGDAQWVASVRRALLHAPVTHAVPAAPPHRLGELRAPAALAVSAPTLPPAAAVAAVPRPATDDSHPVPPALIPDAVRLPQASAPAEGRPAMSTLIAQIPLLGRVVGH
jgi:hypothetical protein